ncbi:MAG TPA: ABC transporter ATP-binding protein [Candidatus Saccharimonadales bacterium]|nr:ABC transporter ATP-binding protein [Candidatus Saccharimonadales bacterium]
MARRHPHLSSNQDPTLTAKSRSTWEIVARVSKYLKPYKLMAAGTIGFAILSLASSFAFPQLTQYVVDDVIAQQRPERLLYAIAGIIAAFFLRDLFNSVRIRINNTFEQNVIYDMRREVYGKLQRLPIGYFDARASGDLMTRVIEDVNAVERVLIDGTEQGTVAVLSIAGVLIILFHKSALLTCVALAPIPLLTGGALWYTLTAHKRYRAQRLASSAMNALLMDNLSGVRQIKAYGAQEHEDKRFAQRADELREGTLQVMRAWAWYSPAMSFATALGSGLVLWVGGRLVLQGTLSLGQLVSFLFFLALFYEPVSRLHGLNQMLQAARAAGERVFDILDAVTETSNTNRQQELKTPVRGEVQYDHVSFGYTKERPVLKQISLRARPGEMIALVGPTGAGKSTLVNLLPAFYEATSGQIRIDSQDTSVLTLDSLRRNISVVSQEPFLFNGTIRENILYGNLHATEAQMMDAARAANCHEFITHLPETYDSRVGERGVKLSVGEKQRVSIARALLKNAPILILDEATASVDTATEKLIQEALERLLQNRTSFVIAHRLSTIRKASQILVMRHGEIVEKGTHEELLEENGLYAKLARIQNTTFIEEGFEKISPAEEVS